MGRNTRGKKGGVGGAIKRWSARAVDLKRHVAHCTPATVSGALIDSMCCTKTTSIKVLDVVMPYVHALCDERRRLTAALQVQQYKLYLLHHDCLTRIDRAEFYANRVCTETKFVMQCAELAQADKSLADIAVELGLVINDREGEQCEAATNELRCGICARWFGQGDEIAFPESGASLIFHEFCLAAYIYTTAIDACASPFFVFPGETEAAARISHGAYYAGSYCASDVMNAMYGSSSLAEIAAVRSAPADTSATPSPRMDSEMDAEPAETNNFAEPSAAPAAVLSGEPHAATLIDAAPVCATEGCGATLVLRNGVNGPFWGCPNYKRLKCKTVPLGGKSDGCEPTPVVWGGSRLLLPDDGAPMAEECGVRMCIKRRNNDKRLMYACPNWARDNCKCGIVPLPVDWKCPRGAVAKNRDDCIIGPAEAPDVAWPTCGVCRTGMYARMVGKDYVLECDGCA